MKLFHRLAPFVAALLVTLPLHAQFIDTFVSSSDSSNYNTVLGYNGEGNGAAQFAVNGSQQFQPTAAEDSTTQFFRNTGESLSATNFGSSVSIDIDHADQTTVVGLAFATSLAGANTTDAVLNFTGQATNRTGTFTEGSSTLANITTDFSLGAVTETITRTGATTFSFSLSGPGLTSGPVSGTFSDTDFNGSNVDFGMEVYGGQPGNGPSANQIEDNLAFTPSTVPEPSTWVMGAAMLVLVGATRLRRVIFRLPNYEVVMA